MTDISTPGKNSAAPSLADIVGSQKPPTFGESFTLAAWIKVAVLGLLVIAINYRFFPMLWFQWRHDPNWTHGMIIPLFSVFLLYTRRDELAAAARKGCTWGLPIIIAAIVLQVLSIFPGKNNWLAELNIILLMLGVALYVGGTQIFRLTWVPIAFLFFAVPIPDRLYTALAYPLQEFAAKCSYQLLQFFGVNISVAASNLSIYSVTGQHHDLTVAEACSGVRSLMAFVALSVAMAYIQNRPWWHRLVFVFSAIPIAILCNVLRVAITCEMFVIDKPALGEKFMHEFTGMLMLPVAFLMLFGVGRLLRSLYVEEEVDDDSGDSDSQTPAEVKT